MNKRKIIFIFPILMMILIFYMSDMPGAQSSSISDFVLIRKLAHIGEYSLLYILLFLSLFFNKIKSKSLILFLPLAISILYSISDEIHQSFVIGRNGTPIDVCIDSIGIFLALFLMLLFYHLYKKKFS